MLTSQQAVGYYGDFQDGFLVIPHWQIVAEQRGIKPNEE